MGESGSFNLAKRKLWNWISLMMVLLALLFQPAYCQQCRIQRCNSEYVASTSPSGGGGLGDEGGLAAGAGTGGGGEAAVDYCTALRAYSLCTRRTSRGCHGDLTYHAALLSMRELFSQHNCSSDGPTSPAKVPGGGGGQRPGGGGGGGAPVVPQLCDYESRVLAQGPAGRHKKYAHCGLFGDPHLRTFRDEFQTCKVEGAWPLIDNRYLSVQVTNVPVVQGSSATATSKITVIFKAYEGCTEQKVYQATTEDLPSAFQDGTRGSGRVGSGGGGGGGGGAETAASSSLWISEQSGGPGGRLVRLQARHIGTSIIVRRVGRYLTFAIRMPEDALEPAEESESGGLQLCLRGCPRNELIQEHTLHHPNPNVPAHAGLPPPPPPHQAYSVERATTKCRETLQVEDVYFQSCVFDLLTTGDPEFSMAAFGALEDLKALPPSRLKQTPPWTPTDDNNNKVPDGRGSKVDSGVGNSARESQATTTHTVLLVTLIVALMLV